MRLDEQSFRTMAVLFDQADRQCVARVVGTIVPISLVTPTSHLKQQDNLTEYVMRIRQKNSCLQLSAQRLLLRPQEALHTNDWVHSTCTTPVAKLT